MAEKTFAIPLDKATNHPIMIGVEPNPVMGRWDIFVTIGNYKTRADAELEAKTVKDALEKAIKANFGHGRVQ